MWSSAKQYPPQLSKIATRATITTLLASVVAFACASCVTSPDRDATPTTTTTVIVTSEPPPDPEEPRLPPIAQEALEQAVVEAANRTGATVSAALANRDASINLVSGPEPVPVAWSTSKVPLAVAAVGAEQNTMRAAIQNSDNGAADALWWYLGGGEQAAGAVSALIGVPVPAYPPRAGFSAYGQTPWPLVDQAQFAANLPCIPNAGPVLEAMQHTSQYFGFAAIPGTANKAGWGPRFDGRYEVRQMALAESPHGPMGVAIHVVAADGTFVSATAAATEVADVLAATFELAPAMLHCG